MNNSKRYDHKYRSCSRTYATLCIFHKSADPQKVTSRLKITPDKLVKAGDLVVKGKYAPISSWQLKTKDVVKSKDLRAHIDWIIDKISGKKAELRLLKRSGYYIKVTCFWISASGNGGPIIDHPLTKRLSKYPIDLEFDIWFSSIE